MKSFLTGCVCVAAAAFAAIPASAAALRSAAVDCGVELAGSIPNRAATAPTGSDFGQAVMGLAGGSRDQAVASEVLHGNIPDFLRELQPVALTGTAGDGSDVTVTICVTPDYLAVGTDADYLRVPVGLPAAAQMADSLGFMLPTTRMVDAIYQQAKLHVSPSPMPPTSQMTTTAYFYQHNQTVDRQIAGAGLRPGDLVAGQKKDIVLTNRLLRAPGKVAIYGWHRSNGAPIQPLSTVHGGSYADYSHGVRLVAKTAFVNGEPTTLDTILSNPTLAAIVSSEGPIQTPSRLMASLY